MKYDGVEDISCCYFRHKANGDRSNAANILIVVTDGQSVNQRATFLEASALHNLNFNVLAVGVGDGVDYRELSAIASSPGNVFTVSNFDALATLEDTLERTACAVSTPPPGEWRRHPCDVYTLK